MRGDLAKARRGQWKLLRAAADPAVTHFFSRGLGALDDGADTGPEQPQHNARPCRRHHARRAFFLRPETGKTHQLRVALKSVGSPILGDELYGGGGEKRRGNGNGSGVAGAAGTSSSSEDKKKTAKARTAAADDGGGDDDDGTTTAARTAFCLHATALTLRLPRRGGGGVEEEVNDGGDGGDGDGDGGGAYDVLQLLAPPHSHAVANERCSSTDDVTAAFDEPRVARAFAAAVFGEEVMKMSDQRPGYVYIYIHIHILYVYVYIYIFSIYIYI